MRGWITDDKASYPEVLADCGFKVRWLVIYAFGRQVLTQVYTHDVQAAKSVGWVSRIAEDEERTLGPCS